MPKTASVLFVDDDPDLCAIMNETFFRLGARRCHTVSSLQEVQEMGGQIHDFDLAVLDINLGPGLPNGVEVFHWLEDHGFEGRIVFLTGHAHDDPRVVTAAAITGAVILSKPVRSDDLRRLMDGGGK